MRASVAFAVGIVLVVIRTSSIAQDDAGRFPASEYQLIEEWSVAAQGPVHLREKRVKATYDLEVTDLGESSDGNRRLRLRFVEAAVEAEIPAQKRKCSYDSRKPPAESAAVDHELVLAMALYGQKLDLTFAPDGSLKEVTGTDAAIRRLDELYDRNLRGSEQDLYTREFERGRIAGPELCRSWADLFVARDADRTASGKQRARPCDIVFTACIPSESWMCQVTIPATEQLQVMSGAEGGIRIEKSAERSESKRSSGDIGGATWSYEPKEASRTTKMQVTSDGRVESMSSTLTAVLATTLSLGTEIPIQMTIRHTTELSKR